QTLAVDYPCDIDLIVVDDGSRDGTADVLARFDDARLRVLTHARNYGKGAAIRTGAQHADGDYLVMLDADLEYDPQDLPQLLAPVRVRRAKVVCGNRVLGSRTAYSFWYVVGKKAIATAASGLYHSCRGGLETCFERMPVSLFRSLDIRSRGFGI